MPGAIILSIGHSRGPSSKTPGDRGTFSKGIQDVIINYNYQSICTALRGFTQCCFIYWVLTIRFYFLFKIFFCFFKQFFNYN